MKLVYLATAAVAALVAGTPAMAQAAQSSDVNSYLCTFAGKCGDTDVGVTKAAPATKGFRLATAQAAQTSAQPTVAAPATKGFRIASGGQQAVVAAPPTKSFRIAKVVTPARSHVAVAVPAATSTGTRANLMLAFEYNSAQMTPTAEAKARTFAQALMMNELKDKRFLIEGHTDARGSRDANIDLSRRRAQSVADFLVSQGVDKARVEVKGVGPDAPLPGHSAASEANRRVEAVLLS